MWRMLRYLLRSISSPYPIYNLPTWALSEWGPDWERGSSANAAGSRPASWQWLVMAPLAVSFPLLSSTALAAKWLGVEWWSPVISQWAARRKSYYWILRLVQRNQILLARSYFLCVVPSGRMSM